MSAHGPVATIVLASGGTGGHLFPAEALAHVLLARGYRVCLVTDDRAGGFVDGTLPIETHRLKLKRGGSSAVAKTRNLVSVGWATLGVMGYLRHTAPAAIVGFGGYPSVPAVAAGQLLAIPTILHEQNTVFGRANRALARGASAIGSSFATLNGLPENLRAKVVPVGHPVRPAFETLRDGAYTASQGDEPINLLVTGGSQGATVFGQVVPEAISRLPDGLRARLRVTQQCRGNDCEGLTARYASLGVQAEIKAFFDDIPARLGRAHLAIGRAGASTVIETAMAGRPALYVPLPGALSDEQTSNAWSMETAGAAIMVKQDAFTPEYLATRLEALLGDPERLMHMAAAARATTQPRAAERLASLVEDVLEARAMTQRVAA